MKKFFIVLFVLMFLSDSANAVLIPSGSGFYKVSLLLRLAVTIIFLFALFLKKQKDELFVVLTMWLIFLIGYSANIFAGRYYPLFANFVIVNKMLFFFLCWGVFSRYLDSQAQSKLLEVYEAIVLIVSFTVFIGFVFDIQLFASYYEPEVGTVVRFGYQGVIPSKDELSGFYILAVFYFTSELMRQPTPSKYIKTAFILVSSLVTGTKVSLIGPLIACSIYLIKSGFLKKRIIWSFLKILLFVCVIAFIVYYFSDYISERVQASVQFFSYWLERESLITVLSSGRDYKLLYFLSEMSKISGINVLLGGMDVSSYAVEMDPVDVFAVFGILGLVYFYIRYVRLLITCTVGRRSFERIFFVVIWIGISTVAGHLVYSAINGMYLSVFLLYLNKLEEYNFADEKKLQQLPASSLLRIEYST